MFAQLVLAQATAASNQLKSIFTYKTMEEIKMENKFLGYENEAELVELAETNANETGAS